VASRACRVSAAQLQTLRPLAYGRPLQHCRHCHLHRCAASLRLQQDQVPRPASRRLPVLHSSNGTRWARTFKKATPDNVCHCGTGGDEGLPPTESGSRGAGQVSATKQHTHDARPFGCSGHLDVLPAMPGRAVRQGTASQPLRRHTQAVPGSVVSRAVARQPSAVQSPAWSPMVSASRQMGAISLWQAAASPGEV